MSDRIPFTGGAPAVVADVMTRMWDQAIARTSDSLAMNNRAMGMLDAAPQIGAPPGPMELDLPAIPVLPEGEDTFDKSDALFRDYADQLHDKLVDGFSTFITTYFPGPAYYEAALEWCHRAITQGGTGIRASVEQQLWERDRARIGREFDRQAAAVQTEWAARNYPLPPGAMVGQLAQMRTDAARELSGSSREIAIKSFDTEIENTRFAVKELLDWRKTALDAAGRYIGALAGAGDVAARMASSLAQAKQSLASAMVQLYNAQINAQELVARVQENTDNRQMRANEANQRALMEIIDGRVKLAMAAAQMLATQAAAGLNALNASASISGSDSSRI